MPIQPAFDTELSGSNVGGRPRKSSGVVLVVDDEPAQRELFTRALASTCRVHALGSVAEALEEAGSRPPSAVVMDYSMPGENGLEGLRMFRAMHPKVPVIIISGYADLEVARQAIALGALEYMIKPFELTDLVSVISRCLKLPAASELSGGNLTPAAGRQTAVVDLWRGRMPTVPSDNRMEIHLPAGQKIEAKVLRLSRNVLHGEVYDSQWGLTAGDDLQNIQVWVGSSMAYEGAGTLQHVIPTGSSHICEFTLHGSWTENSNGVPTQHLNEATTDFLTKWESTSQILPSFKLAVADVSALLQELKDWLDGVELSWVQEGARDLANEETRLEWLMQETGPALDKVFKVFEDESLRIPADLIGYHAEYVRARLHPLTLCSPFVHRAFTKPLFYPGDFGVMNYMLGYPFEGKSLFSRVFNAWVIRSGACATYRHRVCYMEDFLKTEIERTVAEKGRPARILSLGCGCAPEVQRLIRNEAISEQAAFTLFDFNPTTVKYARERMAEAKAATGRSTEVDIQEFSVQQMLAQGTRLVTQPRLLRSGMLARGKYDILYCAGLFDYLSERVCKRILEIFWEMAAPGAAIVATNFAPPNPMRAFMDYVLDWRLIHREEPEVRVMAVDDSLNPETQTVFSPGKTEIFLHMRKPEA